MVMTKENKIDEVFFLVNDIYSKYDNGQITTKTTINKLKKVCEDFIKKGEDFDTSIFDYNIIKINVGGLV